MQLHAHLSYVQPAFVWRKSDNVGNDPSRRVFCKVLLKNVFSINVLKYFKYVVNTCLEHQQKVGRASPDLEKRTNDLNMDEYKRNYNHNTS